VTETDHVAAVDPEYKHSHGNHPVARKNADSRTDG
jgi:hypothetical protein